MEKNLLKVGRVCVKKKGREAGKTVVIIENKDKFVLVDGLRTRRRKCNPVHLFPTDKVLDLKENASHEQVVKALKEVKE
ncbi:MAG: 50S ribosomal protein L14e [archaeon]